MSCSKDVNKFNKGWCCLFSGCECSKHVDAVPPLSPCASEILYLPLLSTLIQFLTFIFRLCNTVWPVARLDFLIPDVLWTITITHII